MTAAAASSAAETVAAALRERIVDGALPPGERLREVELAAEHGVARHTVRAALQALAGERLVVVERHRGARVADLGEADVVALYELRTALEVQAAHLALDRHGGRLPPAVHDAAGRLSALCAARRPRWPAISAAHSEVHAAIVRAARSPRVEEVHARLSQETRLFLLRVRPSYSLEHLAAEHEQLVADLEEQGPEVLRGHLRASASLLVDDLRA